MSTGLLLDGVFASEAIDSSGEILEMDGLDISDFEDGKGVANYEHKGHDGDTNGEEIVGKIVYCHKIRTEADCKNDREKLFWEKVKLPFLYGVVRMYDGAGHEGAKALAAIVRDSHANDEPIVVGFSIEGSTMEKDSRTNRLKSTIARRVALTLRPCNKTAFSGLLADPNAPEGFDKEPAGPDILAMVPNAQTRKAEHQDPRYLRLGGSEAIYGSAITKAMTAGGYGGAPGTLTGGAALQVEDRKRVLKAGAMAAFRDWDRVTPFKKFLKMRLPEASDEFVDHFDDLVERKMFRVKKAAEVVADLLKHGKIPKVAPEVKGVKESPAKKKVALPALTVQGKAVPPPPEGQRTSSFDPVHGLLTTQRGIFAASTPSQPHPHVLAHVKGKKWVKPVDIAKEFHDEMQAQRPAHQRAMKNWFLINDRYQKGQLSPSVVSHAVAFAMMSPGVPVPMQETMYGHLVDALHHTGHEAPTAQNWDQVRSNWMGRNRAGLPEHSREHFRAIEKEIRAGKQGEGAFIGFNKPKMFNKYFGEYLQHHHNDVVNLMREGRGNSHAVVRKLTEVKGVAPKLARYMMGMMGAGDLVVPDTHFTRHYFGVRPDAVGNRPGTSPDTETQDHLKKALLDHAGSHDTLEGIDEHYFHNHDAVKHVLNDPTLGPYFKGRERQSLFPAFWWHWISIPGHEKRIGMEPNFASNEATDHAPFWNAVNPLLTKSEDAYDPELHIHTAMQHQRWIEQYGQNQALGLYMRHLVPKLLANDAKGQQDLVRKMESLQVDFLVALHKDEAAAPAEIQFGGRRVRPGMGELRQGAQTTKLAILDAGPKDFVAVPHDKVNAHSPEDLIRVSRASQNMKVHAYPEHLDSPLRITSKEHGVPEYLRHPETQALAEGLDFGGKTWGAKQGMRSDTNYWMRTPQNASVFVKPSPGQYSSTPGLSEPRAEGVYHNLARDYFGMGQYVMPTAVVHHPQTGAEHAVIAAAPGDTLNDANVWENPSIMEPFHQSGDTDKMAVMDAVMGTADRHGHNVMYDPEKGLHLIDHGFIFRQNPFHMNAEPAYWAGADLGQPLHPEAQKWATALEPHELEDQLRRHEVPDNLIEGASARLKAIQDHIKLNPNAARWDMWTTPHKIARAKVEGR